MTETNAERFQRIREEVKGAEPHHVLLDADDYAFIFAEAIQARELENRIQNKIMPEIEKGYEQNKRFREALERIDAMDREAWDSEHEPFGLVARKALEESDNG